MKALWTRCHLAHHADRPDEALIGLKLRGLPLDVYGQMGLLVLVSLAAKNGILIVIANQRLASGMELGVIWGRP